MQKLSGIHAGSQTSMELLPTSMITRRQTLERMISRRSFSLASCLTRRSGCGANSVYGFDVSRESIVKTGEWGRILSHSVPTSTRKRIRKVGRLHHPSLTSTVEAKPDPKSCFTRAGTRSPLGVMTPAGFTNLTLNSNDN